MIDLVQCVWDDVYFRLKQELRKCCKRRALARKRGDTQAEHDFAMFVIQTRYVIHILQIDYDRHTNRRALPRK